MMLSLAEMSTRDDRPQGDQIIVLEGLGWEDYERLLATRGDRSAPRIAFLNGTCEIMVPSSEHETLKSRIGRLVEVYCDHANIEFEAVGSWTLRDRSEARGIEPDECYIFGLDTSPRPHLAIEVEWTSGGIDKLAIYRKLDIAEVWWWRRGVITVFTLGDDGYEAVQSSTVLPGVDVEQLASFLDRPRASQAIRAYRAALARRG